MAVVRYDVEGLTSDRSAIKGEIDHRSDEPEACPHCGGELDREERVGHVYIHGPADLEWAAQFGITDEGWYRTRSYDWQCRRHEEHYGPIAIG
jgi:hypothetical protein